MRFGTAVQVLCDSGVDFVVIGGVAANLHGSATVTFDLDVCYSRNSANLAQLAAALAPFHPRPREFPPELPFIWDPATLHNATVLTLQTDLGKLDLLAEVAGVGSFEEVKEQSVEVEAFGRKFTALSLPALIQAKRAAGRHKDLTALPELESLLEAQEE
jgi:predicted nucleotidyltransferase